jgi:hypothetical protein
VLYYGGYSTPEGALQFASLDVTISNARSARTCPMIPEVSDTTSARSATASGLPYQIVERFVRRADGELEPVTEGSTKQVVETRTHAGSSR